MPHPDFVADAALAPAPGGFLLRPEEHEQYRTLSPHGNPYPRELAVTERIDGLMDRAVEANDLLSRNTLERFVPEQLEEVSSMDSLPRIVRGAGEAGLLFVERHLAQDVPAEPAGPTAGHVGEGVTCAAGSSPWRSWPTRWPAGWSCCSS